jgi:hypothetical protein
MRILCLNFVFITTGLFVFQNYLVGICPYASFDTKIEYINSNQEMEVAYTTDEKYFQTIMLDLEKKIGEMYCPGVTVN